MKTRAIKYKQNNGEFYVINSTKTTEKKKKFLENFLRYTILSASYIILKSD